MLIDSKSVASNIHISIQNRQKKIIQYFVFQSKKLCCRVIGKSRENVNRLCISCICVMTISDSSESEMSNS